MVVQIVSKENCNQHGQDQFSISLLYQCIFIKSPVELYREMKLEVSAIGTFQGSEHLVIPFLFCVYKAALIFEQVLVHL